MGLIRDIQAYLSAGEERGGGWHIGAPGLLGGDKIY